MHQIHIPTTLEGSTRKTKRSTFFSMGRTCGGEPRTCSKLSRTCGKMPDTCLLDSGQAPVFHHFPHVRP